MHRNRIIVFAIILIFIISFSGLFIRNIALTRRLSKNTEQLLNELEKENLRIEKLYSNFSEFSSDVNEVRKKLYLPEKNYIFNESAESETLIDGEKENKDLTFYLAADRLLSFNLHVENLKKLATFINSDFVTRLFADYGLSVRRKADEGYLLIKDRNVYYTVEIEKEKPLLIGIKSEYIERDENITLKDDDKEKLNRYIESSIKSLDNYFAESEAVYSSFKSLYSDTGLLNIIKKYNLNLIRNENSNNTLELKITTSDGRIIVFCSLSRETLKFSINSSEFSKFDEFYNELINILEKADKRTSSEIRIDEAKDRIKSIARDEVFNKYLKEKDMTLSLSGREDSDYYYYDFIGPQQEKKGSLGVQKHIGEIYLFDPEDIVIASLKSLLYTSSPEKQSGIRIPENLAAYTGKLLDTDSITLLLIGSHEKNADTIILANFNEKKNKIILISLPRDLYYKNRKINDYYRAYGGGKFTEIVSEITGLEITGYIGVDMYAFIDVINILGGIDVELKGNLTDPTYKVRDNGVWKTLHYDKGFHHFNGIEALRIARSRHTSSDFGRSDRQQLILQGVKDKLNDLNISDMNKIYSIFKAVDEYLDTNLNSMEMISIFLKYKNAMMEKKDGLSVFNVLYNTYSNIYLLKDQSKQYEEGFNRGAWILLPRNNDWNVIKWYIAELLKDK